MLYPVKVYDGEGNLLRIIGVDELIKKSDNELKNSGYIAKQKQQNRINMAMRKLERRKEEESNINLNADGMQGGEQCKDALSNSAEESIPPTGRLKDTSGESESE